MPDFSKRSAEAEIMDDLNCTGHVLDRTLHELEIINKWLGGNQYNNSIPPTAAKKLFK